jgi:serine/threonine-protein kinase
MLSGKQAFSGEDLSLTMANIMTMEPRWDVLPHALPRGVRRLLNRCLRKDPNTRLRDIGEARVEIEESPADPSEGTVRAIPATPESPPVWRRTLPWVVVGVFAIALVVTLLGDWVLSPQPVVRPLMRVALTLPSSQTLKGMGNSPTLGGSVVALSPDGTHLAYSTANRLYLRALDQLEAAPINGTKGGRAPFFSPDGQWMGFWADGELKKVSIRGGTPMTLCEARNPVGASWTPGDLILFAQGPEGIFQVPAAGGTKKLLVSVESGEVARSPQLLPGGEAVLFTLGTYGAVSDAQIVVQALETGERKILISAGIDGRYLPTGHLIFGRAGTLRAVAFGVESLEVRGNPVPVVEGVLSGSSVGSLAAQFSVSDFGLLAYVPGTNTSEENSLVWVDRDGAEEPIKVEPRSYGQARLSPDGRLLALEIEGDIWMYDLTRGTTTRVTFDGGSRAAWTPDGKRIVFTRPSGLFVVPIDGSSDAERLAENRQEIYHSNAVSPDGKTLLLHSHAVGRGENVLTLDLNGQSELQAWRASVFSTVATAFSPDGKWIVYVSNESGQDEIYVSPFPGPGGKTKVSTDGGTQPVWGANGEIFYRQDDRMMAVEVRTEPDLTMGRPQELFEGQYGYGWWGPFPSYDATRDGRRFMMVKEARSKGGTRQEIVLVQNWFEELKHLVPRE